MRAVRNVSMFSDQWLVCRHPALPVEGSGRLAYGIEGKDQTRGEASAFKWAPSYAFIVPIRSWLCFETPSRSRIDRCMGKSILPDRIAAASMMNQKGGGTHEEYSSI